MAVTVAIHTMKTKDQHDAEKKELPPHRGYLRTTITGSGQNSRSPKKSVNFYLINCGVKFSIESYTLHIFLHGKKNFLPLIKLCKFSHFFSKNDQTALPDNYFW